MPTRKLHAPLRHIVDGLVVVVHEVAGHERTVTHADHFDLSLLTLREGRSVRVSIMLLFLVLFLLAEVHPVREFSRIYHVARVQFTDGVEQLALELIGEHGTTNRERVIQRVVNALRHNVIEVFEELVLGRLVIFQVKLRIFDQHETDEIGCETILEELTMMTVLLTWVAKSDDDVPKRVAEARIEVLLVEEVEPLGL